MKVNRNEFGCLWTFPAYCERTGFVGKRTQSLHFMPDWALFAMVKWWSYMLVGRILTVQILNARAQKLWDKLPSSTSRSSCIELLTIYFTIFELLELINSTSDMIAIDGALDNVMVCYLCVERKQLWSEDIFRLNKLQLCLKSILCDWVGVLNGLVLQLHFTCTKIQLI